MKPSEIKASTLNEMLVVMVLTGIISFIAFEGLSLYQQMYRYVILHNKQSTDVYENYLRMQELFSSADSICKDGNSLRIYRESDCIGSLHVNDSVMTYQPVSSLFVDTLFQEVSGYEIKMLDDNSKASVDSLFILSDNVLIKFGICIQPNQMALSDVSLIEKEDNYENK